MALGFVNILILKDLDTDSPNLCKRNCTNDFERIQITQDLQIFSLCFLNKFHKPQLFAHLLSWQCGSAERALSEKSNTLWISPAAVVPFVTTQASLMLQEFEWE